MLSTLRFKNCGCTKIQQTLEFKEGLNVVIGDRPWQKRIILDVLETCMCKHKWKSLPQNLIGDKQKNAYVVCTYYVHSDGSQERDVNVTQHKDNNGPPQEDDSGLQKKETFQIAWIYNPSSKQDEVGTVYLILSNDEDDAIEILKTKWQEPNPDTEIANLKAEDMKRIRKLLGSIGKDIDQHMDEVIKIVSAGKYTLGKNSRAENILDKIYESTSFVNEIGQRGKFEEKNTASLLFNGNLSTVCFGELDAGVLSSDRFFFQDAQVKNKVAVVVTQNAAFLLPKTIDRTYFCRENGQNGTEFISAAPITGMAHRDLRLLTDVKFCSLFFARIVMLVEGDADLTFMKCLKEKILGDNSAIRKLINNEAVMPVLQNFMSEIHLMHMDGETNRRRLKTVCDKLGVSWFFILDKDTVVDKVRKKPKELAKVPKDQKANAHDEEDPDMVKLDKEIQKLKYPEQWNEMMMRLEEAGILAWFDGDIEDMIIGLCIPSKEEDPVEDTTEIITEKFIRERDSLESVEEKDENGKKSTTIEATSEHKLKKITKYPTERKRVDGVSIPSQNERIEVVELVDKTIEEKDTGAYFILKKVEEKRRRVYKKTSFLKDIEKEIKIPFTRWKMSKKPKQKIYNGVASEDNIDKSMDLLLNHSLESHENEMRRLLTFLVTKANKWQNAT